MPMLPFFAVLFLSLPILPSFARGGGGGWSSGGGEFLSDERNPWFLRLNRPISYCIVSDRKGISATDSGLGTAVSLAIESWRRIFAENRAKLGQSEVSLGDEVWIELPCANTTDVTFKFGWDSLTSPEKKFVAGGRGARAVIGMAVRTDYDRERLTGKGFVYLGSDQGIHRIAQDSATFTRPWSLPGLLYLEIFHELGHVFGVPHVSSRILELSNRWVMSELFPEVSLQKWLWSENTRFLRDPGAGVGYFFQPLSYRGCSTGDSPMKCFRLHPKFREGRFDGVAVEELAGTTDEVRAQTWISVDGDRSMIGSADINVYLPRGQKLFPVTEKTGPAPFRAGPGPILGEAAGTWKGRHVLMVLRETGLSIYRAEKNGEIRRWLEGDPAETYSPWAEPH